MDDVVFAFAGAFLQVLGVTAAFCSLMVEVAALVLQVLLMDTPRSSEEDEPRHP